MFESNFFDLVAKNLEQRSDWPAIEDQDRSIGYGELADRTESLAAWLRERGVKRGDRVVIHLHKSIEEVVAIFGVARLAGVFVDISSQWTVHQLSYVLKNSEATALITSGRMAGALLKEGLPDSLSTVLVVGKAPDDPRFSSWNELPEHQACPPEKAIDTDLAALIYTSGSTGLPKGVMLTHLNLLNGARTVATYLENVPDDRVLSLLPFCFDAGLNQLTTMCAVGGTTVLQRVMMPAEIVNALAGKKITGLAGVPPAWIQIVNFLIDNPVDLPHLRYVTNTGGKIPQNTLEAMPEVFKETAIVLMYGLTEAFRSTYLEPEMFQKKMGSIGRAVPNVETYIIGDGICGPGETGELVHRGSLISLGYWGDRAKSEEKIKPCPQLRHLIGDEKVCYSGDLIRIDEDGYYWFVSRNDAQIKSRGFRISPGEVEDYVSQSGLVEHVVAFGIDDPEAGQAVAVVVTAKGRAELDGEALLRHCRDWMPQYMVPQVVYLWKDEMPRTGSGKLDRPAVLQAVTSNDPAVTVLVDGD